MDEVFDKYLHALRQDRDDKTELSDRGALETLLKLCGAWSRPGHSRHPRGQESSRQGRPRLQGDEGGMYSAMWRTRPSARTSTVLKSDQIARYKQLSNNILLTDYLQFVWLKDGKVNGRELVAFLTISGERRRSRARIASRRSRRCCAPFSPLRRKASAGRSSSRLRSPHAATSCATFSIANCGDRRRSTRKAFSTASIRFFAIRSFTN